MSDSFVIDKHRYHPEPDAPVDRWFQAANASNARTTATLLRRLAQGQPAAVVDPFAGGGSSAVAARMLQLPFYGIESDPVLACVSLAKAEGRPRHVQHLPDLRRAGDEEWLPRALTEIADRSTPADVPVVSALAVVAALYGTRNSVPDAEMFRADLSALDTTAPPGRTVRGDAASDAAWAALRLPDTAILGYTSPPFGVTSSALDPPARLREAARDLLSRLNLDTLGAAEPQYAGYPQLVLGMLRNLAARVRRGVLVLEHEPSDDKVDSTDTVVERVAAELDGALHSARIDRYDQFSVRGNFSLITFRIR